MSGAALHVYRAGTAHKKLGILLGTFSDDFILWYEHNDIFTLFLRLSTQWRVSMGGVVGLDYMAAYPLLDRLTNDNKKWHAYLDDLRILEDSALCEMNRK